MKYNPDKYHRHSIRLQGYDYSQIGKYFITICTYNRKCIFGNITNGIMILNDPGLIVEKCWNSMPSHFPHVELDEWVIMHNHIHGILSIIMNVNGNGVGIGVTEWMRQNTNIYNVWQRNYWEHIIRNENELNKIRMYIRSNPIKWQDDKLNGDWSNVIREETAGYADEDWMV